jgi:SAM-dependent methyltransferase
MSRTYDFIVNLATSKTPPPAKLLDFGCGDGQVITKALAAGYDAHGTDLFEGVWDQYRASASALNERLHIMPSPTKLPFSDASFDIVISNQVFEHVEEKAPVIAELSRVIRPGGVLIAIFPTRDVLIEPHLKVPLIHRFPQGTRRQKLALDICHRLGLASDSSSPREEWIQHAIGSLSSDIFYIPDQIVPATFGPAFKLIQRAEADFLRDRLANSQRLKSLANFADHPLINASLRKLCLRLANGVYIFRHR